MDLTWTPAPGAIVAGYNVYRQVNGSSPVLLNNALVANALFTDSTPPNSAPCYSVATVDTLGRESARTAPQCIQVQPTDTAIAPLTPDFGLAASPNPFNPMTTLVFDLPAPAHARIVVYDARGRRVATLLDAERARGQHRVRWHGLTDGGIAAPSGAYFAVLFAGNARAQCRLVLLK